MHETNGDGHGHGSAHGAAVSPGRAQANGQVMALPITIMGQMIMDMAGSSKSDKLGLSILCGLYSLMLIVIGIWKKKKYLRIGAISLFGVTLVKLFLYDLAHLTTIAKTIVLVSLGLLLLIMSFLYNKYTNLIENEDN